MPTRLAAMLATSVAVPDEMEKSHSSSFQLSRTAQPPVFHSALKFSAWERPAR